ncbi:MAG TPA: DUF433 domain-containing protein [Polyangiaceae bacterium]
MQAFEARPPPLTEDSDGVLRVAGTRVTLDSIVIAFDMGATPEEIVQRYPSVDVTSVYEVIAYVLRHRAAVDEYLAVRRLKIAAVQVENEKRFGSDGLRARLLARRDGSARSGS